MRHTFYILFILFVTAKNIHCQNIEKIIGNNSIEHYQEYLIMNPHSPLIIAISDSLRKMWDRENIKNYHCFCNCNCIELLVNSENKILLENKEIDISKLKDSLVYAIENPDNKQNLPEKEIFKSDFFGDFIRSKGIIDIISRNTNQKFYSEIIKTTESAFIEIREKWSKYLYDTDYNNLDTHEKAKLDKLLPIRIRFERYMPWNLRLPAPPNQHFNLNGISDIEDEVN
ncbi:hypothetical protein SAMN06265379_1204 [Saccharicrinis carchari]|uniref:Uncharacterized protein n=1 Tax=Saccharicrinis carchari TaxID=1168039 RepID=A0A521FBM2_SACCC|nr:hypothetical protein [Saccharicrinis carchari]SMO93555.1 hypothetical protein SAMN06265379_1204 [Saccharicrinis carchari]